MIASVVLVYALAFARERLVLGLSNACPDDLFALAFLRVGGGNKAGADQG